MKAHDLIFLDPDGKPLAKNQYSAFIGSEYQSWSVQFVQSETHSQIFADLNGVATELWKVGDQYRLVAKRKSRHLPGKETDIELARGHAGTLVLYADEQLRFPLSPKLIIESSLLDNIEFESILRTLGRLAEGIHSYLTVPREILGTRDFESFFNSLTTFEEEKTKLEDIRHRALSLLKNLSINSCDTIELGRKEVDLFRQSVDARLTKSIILAQGRRRLFSPTKVSAPRLTDLLALIDLIKSIDSRLTILHSGYLPKSPSAPIDQRIPAKQRRNLTSSHSSPANSASEIPVRRSALDIGVTLNQRILSLRRELGETKAAIRGNGFNSFNPLDYVPIERSPKLYERWCTAAFAIGLRARGFELTSNPADIDSFVQQLSRRGTPREDEFENNPSFEFSRQLGAIPLVITLHHEPKLNLNRHSQAELKKKAEYRTPDLVVDGKFGIESRRWIFDAKFRPFDQPDLLPESFEYVMKHTIEERYRSSLDADVAGLFHPSNIPNYWDDNLRDPQRFSTSENPNSVLSLRFVPSNHSEVLTTLLSFLLYQSMKIPRKEGMCCQCGSTHIKSETDKKGALRFWQGENYQCARKFIVCDSCKFFVVWRNCGTCNQEFLQLPTIRDTKYPAPNGKGSAPEIYKGQCPCGDRSYDYSKSCYGEKISYVIQ